MLPNMTFETDKLSLLLRLLSLLEHERNSSVSSAFDRRLEEFADFLAMFSIIIRAPITPICFKITHISFKIDNASHLLG